MHKWSIVVLIVLSFVAIAILISWDSGHKTFSRLENNTYEEQKYYLQGNKDTYFIYNLSVLDDVSVSRAASNMNKIFVNNCKNLLDSTIENEELKSSFDNNATGITYIVHKVNNEWKSLKEYKADTYCGYEDPRLFRYKDSIWVICSFQDKDKNQSLVMFDYYKPEIEYPLRKKNRMRTEKNWSPFTVDGELHFIYKIDPLVIVKYGEDNCETVHESSTAVMKHKKIGSSCPPIPITYEGKQCLLCTGHNRINLYKRCIRKNFFYIMTPRPPFKVIAYSDIFSFDESSDVEFLCGMYEKNDNFYCTYGVNDCYNKISELSKKTVFDSIVYKVL